MSRAGLVGRSVGIVVVAIRVSLVVLNRATVLRILVVVVAADTE